MRDDNIYDVEDFEHVKEENNGEDDTVIIEEELREESNFEKDSYVHPINNISNDKPKKKRKSGTMKFIATALIAGIIAGGVSGGGVYYLMKNNLSNT